MKTILLKKLKESLISVLPVILIVLLINLTPLTSFTGEEIITFIISAFFLVFGIGLFNIGADLAMTPMGEHVGGHMTRTRKLWFILLISFVMGVMITASEPAAYNLASVIGILVFVVVAALSLVVYNIIPSTKNEEDFR